MRGVAEEDLNADVRDTVGSLRAARGGCPDGAALVEYHERAGPDRQTHAVHAHVQLCSRCQLVLLHLDEPQTMSARRPAWIVPLAAAIALAVITPFVYRGMKPPPPPDTVRGTDLQPVAPVGGVRELREFRWQSPIDAVQYRVRVFRDGTEIWSAMSTTTYVAPDGAARLERGVEYSWIVEALDREGSVRLQSPRQSFTILPR